ncbi:UNVERIFIED_CONTAM: Disease resistance protein [Sesamum radiatum]|uniref:Disease resistance protein n=1 Tax=Sesamum radiatum TaxID=300843 RepID=A0AAW2VN06_SESRA
MEVLASAVGVVLAEPCRALSTFLRAKIKNPFYFNLRALHKEIEDLMERRDQVNEHLESAAKVGQTALPQVTEWLRRVDRFESQLHSLRGELDFSARNRAASSCLLCSRLPDQVAHWLNEARKLRGDGKFPEGVAGPDPFPVRSEYIPSPTIDDQATASRNMTKVMDMLSREDIKRIGIWGMGGVGKTTLVKNINNKLTSPSHDSFSIVIWITVSNKTQETESEQKKVQKLIADRLKLALNEESMETRASKLHARLMMEKTFLLILDDVWDPIDLDLVGIPALELHKRGKIILTTRFSHVCSQMTEVTLKIEVLNEEEAWRLFSKSAGEVANLGDVEPLAKAITKECAGLPLAIVVVGASLRGKRMVELWKDALHALRRSEPLIRGRMEDKVYNPIKWSYDVLPNQCIKSCFLFCCLFPEDFRIDVDKLVMYWLAEGLLEGHHDIEEVMHRGMTIIDILTDCSLLEQIDVLPVAVRIHDVIRDVSVWISSSLEKECKSLVKSGIGLYKIREGELSGKSYKRVSFMDNQINELPNAVTECPTVSTLFLQRNKELEEIPEQFLAAFMSLKILDLSGCHLIKSLPPCLDRLVELQALVLVNCSSLETLPSLGGLAKLQVLVCSGTGISTLPQGMGKLTSLKLLDLSVNLKLEAIPTGIMSGLSKLEYLDMIGNDQLKFTGERGEISTQFKEILSLDQLITLFIGLDTSSCPVETTSNTLVNRMKKLKKFKLFIGFISRGAETFLAVIRESTRMVIFMNIHQWGERIAWLFANSTSIYLYRCKGLDTMFEKLIASSDEVGSFDTSHLRLSRLDWSSEYCKV